MGELLQALDRRRFGLRRRTILVIAVATTALAGAVGYRQASHERTAICEGASSKLEGIWDDPRRKEVMRAFDHAGTPYAHDAWLSSSRQLDDYTQRWVAMRTDACLATRVRGEQSAELLDLRVACLDDRLQRVAAVTKIFATADARVVEKAVEAVQSLPSVEPCADVASLRSGLRPPSDAAMAARVAVVRAKLALVTALDHAGKYKEAVQAASAALEDARAVQYLPVEAEALFQQGIAEGDLEDTHRAEATLEEAATVAEAGAHHEIAARAWINLAYFVGYEQTRFEQGYRWLRYAATAIERMGGSDELEAERVERLGLLDWASGKNESALANLERARVLFEKTLGPEHIAVAKTLDAIALVRFDLGTYDAAADLQARAVAIDEKAYGALHPVLAVFLNNRANSLLKLGRYDEALVAVRRSLDILGQTVGPEHPSAYFPLDTLGNLLHLLGRLDEADAALKHARGVLDKAGKTAHPDYAEVLNDIGKLERDRGSFEDALASHTKALAIGEASLGAQHRDVAMTHFDIGEVLLAQGKFREALAEDQKALAVVDTPSGTEESKAASVLTGIGEAELGADDALHARASLGRALSLREHLAGEAPELARTRFALARALWIGGTAADQERALGLAEQARQTFVVVSYPKGAAERVTAWMAKHKPS
jgi:tetratricopeptide (TPR) repeat protein